MVYNIHTCAHMEANIKPPSKGSINKWKIELLLTLPMISKLSNNYFYKLKTEKKKKTYMQR